MYKSYEDLERLVFECKSMLAKRDKEIEALKAERDALAAQVDRLQKEKSDLLVYVADSEMWFNKHDPNGYVSPKRRAAQQCLRDVQAEAGREGFLAGATKWIAAVHPDYADDATVDIEMDADKHAATVRQGNA